MPVRPTTLLLILDGWGYREEAANNALYHADTPVWDRFWQESPHTLIQTSGTAVGLPDGQMGNSEVGHMNLGAGRILYQNLTRIDKDIAEGTLAANPAIASAIAKAAERGSAVHIIGLLSPGGVHSHEDHLIEACRIAARGGAQKVFLHAFLDGRDTPPQSAEASLRKAEEALTATGRGRIASICGRYFAMDRDNRWDRVEKAWNLLTAAKAEYHADDPVAGLQAAYQRGENDEFVKPVWIGPREEGRIADGDVVLFMNFRADRARQLARCFTAEDFDGFTRSQRPNLADFVMLTQYADDIDASCAYPPDQPRNGIGEYLASCGKTQLRIAETEKYAHVTFFFSGGQEECYEGEARKLIPSPQVATYDLKPEMSAPEVTDEIVKSIEAGSYDFIVCNYANGDMVGHTGIFSAAVKAVEAVDLCLGRIDEALSATGSQCLITADHGNVEEMVDDQERPHTQHTTGPVPLVYRGPAQIELQSGGRLCDIAPSLLELMGLSIPQEMTGRSLIKPAS